MDDGKLIMVIEDELTIRQLIVEILQEAGHQVMQCASGEEALSRLASANPSVITLDLAMPSMDGIEFLRMLRGRADAARIAVVVVTAAPEFVREELSGHGYTTLAKPFHVDQLLEAVEAALVRRQSET